jgi:glycerol-3-phosphate dehydrogenase (NAD(P)+)
MAAGAGGAIRRIAVVGAGAWGTALAQTAARGGCAVVLWGRDAQAMAAIARTRSNPRLPGVAIDARIKAVADLAEIATAEVVLLAVPAQSLREVCGRLPQGRAPLVICAKGFETASGRRLSEVVEETCPGRTVAVLSGPNFAGEVAAGLPAASTLACSDPALGRRLAEALSSRSFRVYWSDDLIGVEAGGALKNVLAIAAGAVVGRGLGENARAALISRGLAELARLGEAMGGRRETLMGLSGLGDLVLTATSLTSRNAAFGHALGQGAEPSALKARPGPLAEGVFTAAAAVRLARRHGVELPICATVDDVLEGRIGIDAAIERLMTRPLKSEETA